MLTKNEKEYLRQLVQRELETFKKGETSLSVSFLKAEHEYEHFLEGILVKLK